MTLNPRIWYKMDSYRVRVAGVDWVDVLVVIHPNFIIVISELFCGRFFCWEFCTCYIHFFTLVRFICVFTICNLFEESCQLAFPSSSFLICVVIPHFFACALLCFSDPLFSPLCVRIRFSPSISLWSFFNHISGSSNSNSVFFFPTSFCLPSDVLTTWCSRASPPAPSTSRPMHGLVAVCLSHRQNELHEIWVRRYTSDYSPPWFSAHSDKCTRKIAHMGISIWGGGGAMHRASPPWRMRWVKKHTNFVNFFSSFFGTLLCSGQFTTPWNCHSPECQLTLLDSVPHTTQRIEYFTPQRLTPKRLI